MDYLTLLGITVAVGAVSLSQYGEGGQLSALLNGPALLIVLGGTLGAVILQTPAAYAKRALRLLSWVFRPPDFPFSATIQRLSLFSRTVRQQGVFALERRAQTEHDPFLRKALFAIIDGMPAAKIRRVLQIELAAKEAFDLQAAEVFEHLGSYSPTIGILGAVLGLIQVMRHLTEPSSLGLGIATAFVATIYGVGLANLVFLPIANKLKSHIQRQSQFHEMLIEGFVAIAEHEHPKIMLTHLQGFQHANAA